MQVLATLVDELKHNEAAQAAMDVIASSLERRTEEEQGAFWKAVGLYYLSRKHPGAEAKPAAEAEGA
ncbi:MULTISPECIES: hypothetical protein [Methylobacterium]|uniref:Uncharacterized protein n=1 Tax=Methylobacterium jeotgali TaxID=381630 RepID=A0ABQ4SUP9_9HYPH|nr:MULTISPECIES: hypothetical protein [Methylobacterium]PIU07457.1 MAG: hypothetical protein COT56_05180 [Methylobacterium sp. CG09_land_8_20_14_0_10_71_15]PIU13993.1 MAG: hypothetical protein COT28_09645 [Methylobacterium sp. CG08_land_8_20_14_0_20_71_15]GBU17305.1 hypothetical protein AwMethylo_15200 [Methylobacterium sp.]GJE05499.1 hypothetical protein AOPFMNJM_0799 [Methylobacterium jeotgali]